jgi:alpha-L-fucosidase 2
VDIEWMDGKLVKLGLLSAATKTTRIKYDTEEVEIKLPKNKKVWLNSTLKY